MPARLVTPPQSEPVSLREAKQHLRLEHNLDDDYVLTQVSVARTYVEQICWRSIMLQTWEITLAGFRGKDRLEQVPEWQSVAISTPWASGGGIYRFQPYLELDRGHLADTPSVVITYYDENNALQTLSSSAYRVVGAQDETRYGRVFLNDIAGYSWPNTAARSDAVKISAAYGYATASKVPEPIKHAVKLLVSQLYEQRTPQVTGTIVANLEFTLDALIAPYRFNTL